jgi:hypothetical protein
VKAVPPARGDAAPPEGEVLFEWRVVGASLRVAAIDAASGVEVVVFGPAAVGFAALRRLAARKLRRRLESG